MAKPLGETFRELRLNRNLSLQQIAGDSVSLSQLSRFERGQSDISLNKFLVALDRMHVEVKEFMDVASDFKKLSRFVLCHI